MARAELGIKTDEEIAEDVSIWQETVGKKTLAREQLHRLTLTRPTSHAAKISLDLDIQRCQNVLNEVSEEAYRLFKVVFTSIRRRSGNYPLAELRFHDGDFSYLHVVKIPGYSYPFIVTHRSESLYVARENETPFVEIKDDGFPLLHVPDKHPIPVEVSSSNLRTTWCVDVPENPAYVGFSPDLKTVTKPNIGRYWLM